MLPAELPNLGDGRVTLRAFVNDDVDLVRSVARDPLIPLITTVPASGSHDDALSYIACQHARLRTGAGYSFGTRLREARTRHPERLGRDARRRGPPRALRRAVE